MAEQSNRCGSRSRICTPGIPHGQVAGCHQLTSSRRRPPFHGSNRRLRYARQKLHDVTAQLEKLLLSRLAATPKLFQIMTRRKDAAFCLQENGSNVSGVLWPLLRVRVEGLGASFRSKHFAGWVDSRSMLVLHSRQMRFSVLEDPRQYHRLMVWSSFPNAIAKKVFGGSRYDLLLPDFYLSLLRQGAFQLPGTCYCLFFLRHKIMIGVDSEKQVLLPPFHRRRILGFRIGSCHSGRAGRFFSSVTLPYIPYRYCRARRSIYRHHIRPD